MVDKRAQSARFVQEYGQCPRVQLLFPVSPLLAFRLSIDEERRGRVGVAELTVEFASRLSVRPGIIRGEIEAVEQFDVRTPLLQTLIRV